MDTNSIDNLMAKYELNKFKWINTKQIVMATWVRMKCLFGCGDYGKAVCPPNVPTVEECKNFVADYKRAIIIHFNFEAEKNNYPKDLSLSFSKKLREIEKEIFKLGFYKVFLLDQTCCSICDECSKSKIGCKNPKYSRPSAEAMAIDVYATVRLIGFPINVITDETSQINRYAFIFID